MPENHLSADQARPEELFACSEGSGPAWVHPFGLIRSVSFRAFR